MQPTLTLRILTKEHQTTAAQYAKHWALGNEVLYRLCRENPGHSRLDACYAKVWIVQRAYAAGLERSTETRGTGVAALDVVARHLHKAHVKVDRALARLPASAKAHLNPDRFATALAVHCRLLTLLRPCIRDGRSVRSFVSKYMHFHSPVVPLCDSRANKGIKMIWRHLGWRWPRAAVHEFGEPVDRDYCMYGRKFLRLYEELRAAGAPVTARSLDYLLVRWADTDGNVRRDG